MSNHVGRLRPVIVANGSHSVVPREGLNDRGVSTWNLRELELCAPLVAVAVAARCLFAAHVRP